MKNGYDQFFKQAKRVAATTGQPAKPMRSRLEVRLSEEDVENQLRARMGMKKPKVAKKKKPFPWVMTIVSLLGTGLAYWGMENFEKVENFVKRIEVSVTGEAMASEPAAAPTEAAAKTEGSAPTADPNKEAAAVTVADPSRLSNGELDHITHLNEKKKELAAKEEELARVEQELAAQKVELEKRMKELEEMRRGISSVLEDKVKVDAEKLDTLVQMYTNMKPPQAAKVFEEMDEDLAVEILGKMKKKSAADILNLLKPEKARVISEKFAGYKRR